MMRPKNKSSTEIILDYTKCKFECIVSKKKFLGTTKRYLYIFDNQIVFNKVHIGFIPSKEQKKKKPDSMLLVELTKRVIWKYTESKQPVRFNIKRLESFKRFHYGLRQQESWVLCGWVNFGAPQETFCSTLLSSQGSRWIWSPMCDRIGKLCFSIPNNLW